MDSDFSISNFQLPPVSSKAEVIGNLKNSEISLDLSKTRTQYLIKLGPNQSIPVYFPFEPYAIQIAYMEKVIEALETSENGLLQSPTGTGKTLCLLCASLAWLNYKRKNMNNKEDKPIRILYSSRTHAQLKQVFNELKNTAYRPLTTIIGSRDHYCIKKEFQNLKGLILNGSCAKARKARHTVQEQNDNLLEGIESCRFYQNEGDLISKTIPRILGGGKKNVTELMDIEELRESGKRNFFCPYYLSMKVVNDVDILFLPYNYVIEKRFRKLLSLSLENTVVIFDEAHNIEQVAEDGASFDFSLKDLNSALEELEKLKELHKNTVTQIGKAKKEGQIDRLLSMPEDLPLISAPLINFKSKLSKYLNEEKKVKNYSRDEKGVILESVEIFNFIMKNSQNDQSLLFEGDSKRNPFASGWTASNLRDYLEILSRALEDLSSHAFIGLDKLFLFLEEVLNLWINFNYITTHGTVDWENTRINHYKLYICNDVEDMSNVQMNLWCFSPALAFKELGTNSVRSVILTSGTLAPFKSFEAETKVDFKIMLSNPHIVNTSENLLAGIFTKGPQDSIFNFCYGNREKEEMFIDIGETMINISRHIPNGVLMIFASYQLLDKCYEIWAKHNLLKQLEELKTIIKEPRSSSTLQDRMRYYTKQAKSQKGAILMAVCRGKVSEGLDFSDELARAVIMVGIPFPPKYERRVELKQNYLDMVGINRIEKRKRISGKEWYMLQAIRAMNQAIGRVIRHKNDYGAVLFFDVRYNSNEVKREISGWIRDEIKVFPTFGNGYKEIMEFFKRKKEPTNIKQLNLILNEKQKENSEEKNMNIKGFYKSNVQAITNNRKEIERENNLERQIEKKLKTDNIIITNQINNDPLLELLDLSMGKEIYQQKINQIYKSEKYIPPIEKVLEKNEELNLKESQIQNDSTKKKILTMEDIKNNSSLDDLKNCTLTIDSLEEIKSFTHFLKNKDRFECMICLNLNDDLYSSKCGHVACHQCWKNWLKIKLVCPKCKARVREKTLIKVYNT